MFKYLENKTLAFLKHICHNIWVPYDTDHIYQ